VWYKIERMYEKMKKICIAVYFFYLNNNKKIVDVI
jgi:hypothetical protein